MTLRAKFRTLFSSIFVIFLALGVFACLQLANVNAASEQMARVWLPRVKLSEQMNTAAADYRIKEARYVMASSPEMMASTDREMDKLDAELTAKVGAYRKLMTPGESSRKLDQFVAEWRAYRAANQAMLAAARAQQPDRAAELFRAAKPKFDHAGAILLAISNQDSAAADAASAAASAAFQLSRNLLIGAMIVILLCAAGAAFYFETQVSAVLTRMAALMRNIAGGDLGLQVEGVGRRDEIGEMAAAVEVFKTNGLELRRAESEAETQRAAAEAERRRNEAQRERSAAELADVVANLAGGLGKLSGGDLTCRLETPFAQDYERLRSDFNAAMDKLQQALSQVVETTGAIGAGSSQISQAADDLSKRTEAQAANLEQTAAAVEQITATVKRTAESANHAREVVATAKQAAEESGSVVHKAVAAMNQIQTSAKEIGQIIGVIDEIAFQTNLLALNAGVEAARAGDAGRGFAVVASEVRALAQRSAEAAKEIKALITASGQQVQEGVGLVANSGEALTRISGQVAEINGIVGEIAASAQEQATGLQQVNVAVNQMDQMTQQNAAMVEESTAASHALAQETRELGRLMEQFRVQAASAAAPRRRETPVAVAKRDPGPAPVRQMRTVGSAAVRAEPDWAEF